MTAPADPTDSHVPSSSDDEAVGDIGPWQRLHPLSLVHEGAAAVPSLVLLLVPAWFGIVGTGRVVSALALGAVSVLVGTPPARSARVRE